MKKDAGKKRAPARGTRGRGESELPRLARRVKRLEASEQRLKLRLEAAGGAQRVLADTSAYGYIEMDLDGRVTFVNRRGAHMVGLPARRIVGRSFEQLLAGDDVGRARRNLKRIRTLVQGRPRRYRIRTRARGELTVEVNTFRVNQGGRLIGLRSIVLDVTDRRRAEAALEATQARYRQLVERVQDIIYAADAQGRITFITPSVGLYGYDAKDVQGRSIDEFVLPEDRPVVARDMARTLLEGIPMRTKWRGVTKDGRLLHMEDFSGPLRDERGRITGVHGVIRDVTREHEAEEAMRESQRRYQDLFENAPLALWEHDFSEVRVKLEALKAAGVRDVQARLLADPAALADCVRGVRIRDVNRAALELFAARDKPELMTGIHRVFGEQALPKLAGHLAAMAGGRTTFETETDLRTLEGNPLHVYAKWQIVPGCEDTWSRVLVSMMDITARRKAESALEAATRGLVEAERLAVIGRMAAGLSHEVSQPLTAMQAYTDNTFVFLEQGRLDDVRSNLELTRDLLRRASEITRQVKMLVGGQTVTAPVDLRVAVDNALAFLMERARADGVSIVSKFGGEGLRVRGDSVRLGQVVTNIVGNAFHAMKGRPGRVLELGLERRGDTAVLTFRDTGPGIPDLHLPHLFEPFFTTKPAGEGMGLGLCVSLAIVKEHGGSITAANHPGGGAVFTVELPLAQEPGSLQEAEEG